MLVETAEDLGEDDVQGSSEVADEISNDESVLGSETPLIEENSIPVDGDGDTPIAPDERRVQNGELCRSSSDGFVTVSGTRLTVDISKAGEQFIKVSFRASAFDGCVGKYTDARFINPAPSNIFIVEFGRTEELDKACGDGKPEGAIQNSSSGLKLTNLELPGNLIAVGVGDGFFAENGRRNSNGVYPLEQLTFGDNVTALEIGACSFARVMPDTGGGAISTKPLAINFPSGYSTTIYESAFAELNRKGTLPSCPTRNGFSSITFSEGIKELELHKNSFESQCSNVSELRFPDSLTKLDLSEPSIFAAGTSDLQKVSFPGMSGNKTILNLAEGAFGSKNITDVEFRAVGKPATQITMSGNPFKAATSESAVRPLWQWSGPTGTTASLWGTPYNKTIHGYYPVTFNNVYKDVTLNGTLHLPISSNKAVVYAYGGNKGLKLKNTEVTGFDAQADSYPQLFAPTAERNEYVLAGWCRKEISPNATCPESDRIQPNDKITASSSSTFWASWTDRPSTKWSSYTVDPKPVAAGTPIAVTMTLLSENQQPLANANSVEIIATGISGNAVTVGPIQTTSTPGQFKAMLTSVKSGTSTVEVQIKDGTTLPNTPANTDKANWIPGPVDVGNSDFFVDQTPAIAQEGSVPVTVKARDKHGNVTTVSVSELNATACLGSDCESASVSDFVAVGSGDAQAYSASVSAQKPGTYTVNVQLGTDRLPVQSGKSDQATFRSGAVDVKKSSFVVGASPVVADGKQVVPVIVTLADRNEVPITDFSGDFKPSFAPAQGVTIVLNAKGEQFTNNADGTYTVNIASTKAADVLVGIGTAEGESFPVAKGKDGEDLNDTAHFVAGDPDLGAQQSRFWTTNTEGIVVGEGTESEQKIFARIVDAYNNPVAGLESNLAFAYSPTHVEGPVSKLGFRWNPTSETYEAILTSKHADTYSFEATLNTNSVLGRENGPTVATWIAGDPTYGGVSKSNYDVDSRNALADGKDSVAVTIHVYDKYDNPVPGVSSQLKVFSHDKNTWNISEKNGEKGVYLAALTSTTIGAFPVSVTGQDTEIDVKENGNTLATFVAGTPSSVKSQYLVDKNPVPASGTASVPVCVFLRDQNDNPAVLGEADLKAHVAQPAQVGPFYEVTAQNDICASETSGAYRAEVTSVVPGDYDVTIALGDTNLGTTSGGNKTAHFFVDDINIEQSSYHVTDNPGAVANGIDTQTIQVTLRNASGGTVQGAAHLLEASQRADKEGVSSGDLKIGAFSDQGNGRYSAELTTTVAGTYTLDVHIDSDKLAATEDKDTTHFEAGAASARISSFAVSEYTDRVANGQDSQDVTVRLFDEHQNPTTTLPAGATLNINGDSLQVGKVEASGPVILVPVRSVVAGSHLVEVAIGKDDLSTTENDRALFNTGSLSLETSSFTISNQDGIIANGTDTQKATVLLNDDFGNPLDVDPADIKLTFAQEGPNLVKAGWQKVGPGLYEGAIVSTKSGEFQAQVTYEENEIPAESDRNQTHFIPGIPVSRNSSFDTERKLAIAGEENITLTVTLRDSFGNNATLPIDRSLQAGAKKDETNANIGDFVAIGGPFATTYQAAISTNIAGTYTVTVKLNEQNIPMAADGNDKATWRSGPVSVANSDFFVDQEVAIVQEGNVPITVIARDKYDNITTLSIGELNASACLGSDCESASVSGFSDVGSGDAQAYSARVSAQKPGTYTVNVQLGTDELPVQSGKSDQATFRSGAVDVKRSSFVVGTSPVIADGKQVVPVLVDLVDRNGVPIIDFSDNFRPLFTPAQGVTIVLNAKGEQFTNNGDGTYTVNIASTKAGGVLVGISTAVSGYFPVAKGKDGENLNDTAHFVAGEPDLGAQQSRFWTTDTEGIVVGDGTESEQKIFARIVDAYNNPVAGLESDLAFKYIPQITNGPTSKLGFQWDAGLQAYEAVLTSKYADTFTFGVALNDNGILGRESGPTVATWIAGDPTYGGDSKSNYDVDSRNALADGKDSVAVTIHVYDEYDNPVPGISNQLKVSFRDTNTWNISEKNGVKGIYQASLTSTKTGMFPVSVTGQNIELNVIENGNTNATFVADVPSSEKSQYRVDENAVPASGTAGVPVCVFLLDQTGNPAILGDDDLEAHVNQPAKVGSFQAVTESDDVCATENGGAYRTEVTSVVPGDYLVGVTLGNDNLSVVSGANNTAHFRIDDIDLDKSGYQVSDDAGRVANGVDTQSVHVTLRNGVGEGILGAGRLLDVSVRLADGGKAGGDLKVGEFSDQGNGQYVADLTTTVAGVYTLDVSVDNDKLVADGGQDTTHFDAGVASVATSSFVVSEYPDRVANGQDSQDVTVKLLDENQNPTTVLPAGTVLSISGDSLLVDEVEILGPQVIVPVRSVVAGSHLVEVSIGSDKLVTTENDQAVFKAGNVSQATSSFSLSNDEHRVANGIDTQSVTVMLKDGFGNPLDVDPEEIKLGFAPEGPKLADGGWQNAGSGLYKGTIASQKAGEFTGDVTFEGTVIPSTPNQNLTHFVPGIAVSAKSTFDTEREAAIAGEENVGLTVTLRDSFGNNAVLPEESTLEAWAKKGGLSANIGDFVAVGGPFATTYQAAMSTDIAGIYTVTAKLSGESISLEIGGNDKATWVSGPVSLANSSFFVTQWENVIADGVGYQLITADLKDVYGNAATLAEESKLLATATNENGEAEITEFERSGDTYQSKVTSTRAGDYSVNVTLIGADGDESISASGNSLAKFVAGEVDLDASNFEVDAVPVEVVSGEVPLTVTLRDSTGNPVPGQEEQLKATFDSRQIDVFQYLDGKYTALLSSNKAGDFPVSVMYGVNGYIQVANNEGIAANDQAHFVAGPAVLENSSFEVSEGEKIANHEAHQVSVVARDVGMNIVSVPGNWKLSAMASGVGTKAEATIGEFNTDSEKIVAAAITASVVDDYEVSVSVKVGEHEAETLKVEDGKNSLARFISGPPTFEASNFTVTNDPEIVANGLDTQVIHVVLSDGYGNPVADQEGKLSFSVEPKGPRSGEEWQFDGHEYFLPVTSTVANTFVLSVSWQDMILAVGTENGDTTTFVPGVADIESSSFNVTELPGIQGDGESEQTVNIILRDEHGNLTSLPDSWGLTGIAVDANGIEGKVKEFSLHEESGQNRAGVVSDYYGEFEISVQVSGANARAIMGELAPDGNKIARFTPHPSQDPTIVKLSKTKVEGAGIPGAKITVTKLDGTPLCETTVAASGKWWCAFNTPISVGTTVKAAQTKPGKGPSTGITATLQDSGGSGGFGKPGSGDLGNTLGGQGDNASSGSSWKDHLAQTGLGNIWIVFAAIFLTMLGFIVINKDKPKNK